MSVFGHTLSAKPAQAVTEIAAQDILASGRCTIVAEAKALQKLAAGLDESFVQAVQYCLHTRQNGGRLMICGIGKSGHIGKKIAATFASTGNPAYFIHPSEAAHGDMGMITKNDVIMLLSKSGESSELLPLLDYAVRQEIVLIAITANPNSILARQASVALLMPRIGESPITDTNAPTNSTTMTLALGDALAMALLDQQGFQREDFVRLHPGGTLGAQLTSVAQVMHQQQEIPVVDDQASLMMAVLEMSAKRFGCVGIVDQQGLLCGILTDGDVRRCVTQNPDLHAISAMEIASRMPKTIDEQALCATAISMMEHQKITVLFVTKDGYPIGILHLHDLLKLKVV